jgi:hypothetical protein
LGRQIASDLNGGSLSLETMLIHCLRCVTAIRDLSRWPLQLVLLEQLFDAAALQFFQH